MPIFTKLGETVTSKRKHLIHFGIGPDPNQFRYLYPFQDPDQNPISLQFHIKDYDIGIDGLCPQCRHSLILVIIIIFIIKYIYIAQDREEAANVLNGCMSMM